MSEDAINKEIVDTVEGFAEGQLLFTCPKCGRENVEASSRDPHLCVDCSKAENSRVQYYRQNQQDWLAEAKAAGIDVWARQPRETQWEYTVWCAYRDTYPGKPATYSDIARTLGTTTKAVKNIGMRWTFGARMQAWIAYCDSVTIAQRRNEIIAMNKTQIDMAEALNKKIATAIEKLDTSMIKPGEIATLMRTAAELERKARMDTVAQEVIMRESSQLDDNPELHKKKIKTSELGEVVDILAKAGVLDQMKVTQTVTTHVEPADTSIDVDAEVII